MPRFEPQPGTRITLGPTTYEVTPHPAVPAMAYGQEGRKAIIYQVRSDGKLLALKIFKEQYRRPYLLDTCQALARLTTSGLEVCARECLTRGSAAPILQQYPEMEYAVLMPWMQGATWHDIIMVGTTISQSASKKLAKRTADVLAGLEKRGYAHCDISGGNVIVNTGTGEVSFIDVEDMFGSGLSLPGGFPQGTDGYEHRTSRMAERGQWCAEGDRFSGAVLLAEMLAWHSPQIRKASDEEHYFAEGELQDPHCARYKLMLETLAGLSQKVADCFARAWNSPSLADCPPLNEWTWLLEFSLVAEWLPVQAPPPPAPYRPPSWSSITAPLYLQSMEGLECPKLWKMMTEAKIDEPFIVRWSAVPGARDYELELDGELVNMGLTTWRRMKFDRAGTYRYGVRALGLGPASEWSYGFVNVQSATEFEVPQLYIENPGGDVSFVVRWTDVPAVEWYELEEAKVGAPSDEPDYAPVQDKGSSCLTRTQFEISGKEPGAYQYRVRAHYSYGYGEFSQPVTVTVEQSAADALPSEAPEMKPIDNPGSKDSYWVEWTWVKTATRYLLFESRSPDFEQGRCAYDERSTSVKLTDREPGQYFYRVFACNAKKRYDPGKPSNAQTTTVLPEKPVRFILDYYYPGRGDMISVKLSWDRVKWATRYEVEEAVSAFKGYAKSNSHTIQLPVGTFEIRVRAWHEQMGGEWGAVKVSVLRNVGNRLVAQWG